MLKVTSLFLIFGMFVFANTFESIEKINILPTCKYLVELSNYKSIDKIKVINDTKWLTTQKVSLSLGYHKNKKVWLKCIFKNQSNKKIIKILENDNSHITYISFFDGNITKDLGVILRGKGDDKLTPYFTIEFEPQELKTIYLSFKSTLGPLHVKPILWDTNAFEKYMFNKYIFIGLFFGAMGALLIYNLFILFFTKDIIYLWYCSYLVGILFHQAYYMGILELNILEGSIKSRFVINFLIAFSLFFMPFFTRTFLHTKKYLPKIDKILQYIPLYIVILLLIPSPQIMISFFIPIALFFIVVCIIVLAKKVRQAKYYAFGWLSIALGLLSMGLYNLGLLPFIEKVPYIIQMSIIFEALIFSVGLANRINQLQLQKQESDKKLISHQKSEKDRLELEVKERTKSLQESLDERELLMKELNHRVKNNMQLIVSLLRLQANSEDDEKLVDSLKIAEHRIQAMSHLHELLYSQETLTHIDMSEYIKNMVTELSSNFDPNKNIDIALHVEGKLPLKQAVYLGLILNEMLINAYKHAFKNKGNIKIEFTCKEDKILLHVEDDGVGFDVQRISAESLGYMVITTLIKKQLRGTYELDAIGGTDWKVEFRV